LALSPAHTRQIPLHVVRECADGLTACLQIAHANAGWTGVQPVVVQ